MKTAEELYKKHCYFDISDTPYFVVKNFTEALTDYKQSIIDLIDDTIKRKIPEKYMSGFISGYHKALTELKQKIEEL